MSIILALIQLVPAVVLVWSTISDRKRARIAKEEEFKRIKWEAAHWANDKDAYVPQGDRYLYCERDSQTMTLIIKGEYPIKRAPHLPKLK